MAVVGNTVRLTITFTDFDDVAVDVSSPVLNSYDQFKVLLNQTPIDLTNYRDPNEVGVYVYDYTIPSGTGPITIEAKGLLNSKAILNRVILIREWCAW